MSRLVFESCSTSPDTVIEMSSEWASPTSSFETIQGPMRRKRREALAQVPLRWSHSCMSRALTSFTIV